MKKFCLLLAIVLLSASKSFACLNGEHYILKNGYPLFEDYDGEIPEPHNFYVFSFEKNIKELDSLYKKTKDVAYLSDKGLILILQKKYKDALALYQFIEKAAPGRYSTAANMGTLYELMGDNEKALYWIRKSVEINPKSHEESEWLHVKILEAKLKGKSAYNGAFLLGTDFGAQAMPITKLTTTELRRLEKSLFFQLTERMSFIKPKDPIVATLLFELANIKLLLKKNAQAKEIYAKALEYGYDSKIVDERIIQANKPVSPVKQKKKIISKEDKSSSSIVPAVVGATSAVIILAAARRRRGNKEK